MAENNLCYGWLPVGFYMVDVIFKNNTTYYYGNFNTFTNGVESYPYSGLIKLNEDLSVDTVFDIGTGFNQILYSGESITLQDDGKIICTGFFTSFDGVSQNKVTRLNPDGSIDLAFSQNIGTGFNNYTQGSKVDSNGSIVIVGLFSSFNGTPSSRIARLLSDGTIDPSFAIGSGFSGGSNTGTDVLINPDNSMFCLGYWNTFDGVATSPGITKLTSTGALDPSFDGGTGIFPYACIDNDQTCYPNYFFRYADETSFYVTGNLTSYNNISVGYIVKINEDGSIDTSANFGLGFNAPTYLSTIIWENKIYIQGDFTSYNGIDSYQNIVLNLDGSIFYAFEEPEDFSPYDYYQPLIVGNKIYAPVDGCYKEIFNQRDGSNLKAYTLTFSESVNGWPSFYSYEPDFILGMNQYLYTFKNGNLFRHNTNERRNNYYGIDYPSTITGVFNQEPTTTKIFKTIELESDDAWDCDVLSDLGTGFMPASYFILKEGAYFAYIRRIEGSDNLELRSAQGIGTFSSTTGAGPAPIQLTFSFSIDSMLSVGDVAYYNDTTVSPSVIAEIGVVTSISASRKNITIANPLILTAVPPSYILYVKNSVAESYGTLGYFLQFKLTNNNTEAVELFTVDSDVFKSNP